PMPDTLPPAEPAAATLARRHRAPAPTPPAWNAVLDTILAHRSIRHFLPRDLPPNTLETLIAAAQSAATSSNLQLWSVVAVREKARKSRLAHLAGAQGFIDQAPLMLVWLADLHRLETFAALRGQPVTGTLYLEEFMVGLIDAALAAQNTLLAAESLGLGGVYVGAIRNHPVAVARELALPPRVFAAFGMAIGWPDRAAGEDVKPRLPHTVVLHHETYRPAQDDAPIAAYNATLRAFQREQAMRPIDWTQQCIDRVRDAAALRERETMRDSLAALGFPLR
ncbi:MAG: NADPH-dependent oxidoreductase, partial [Acetobacteraceae bacterium]